MVPIIWALAVVNMVIRYGFTGSTAAKQRQEVWRSKRVFFLTPQVMVNDLSRDTCPAKQIKCVVIDEAHKALGNHAYCQVSSTLLFPTDCVLQLFSSMMCLWFSVKPLRRLQSS